MPNPKVSIIVLNYNGEKYLKNCFESLRKQIYPNYEVIMVDNASRADDPVMSSSKLRIADTDKISILDSYNRQKRGETTELDLCNG
jgi:GT2 family glycosyltransferase